MLELQNITKYYQGATHKIYALKNINLTIKKADFTIIKGPSGSGKTTLLNILSLFDSPNDGYVLYKNKVIDNEYAKQQLRLHTIGFIFQSFNLIPVMSALENVLLPLRANSKIKIDAQAIKKATDLLNSVGLADKIYTKPVHLSGGQQQRVAIARSLITSPEIILADEPTANLDTQTAESIISLLLEYNQKHNITFVFSTHDERLAKYAKLTYKLQDGVII